MIECPFRRPSLDFQRYARKPVELRPYSNADRSRPRRDTAHERAKYFSEGDVLDFERYLHDRTVGEALRLSHSGMAALSAVRVAT